MLIFEPIFTLKTAFGHCGTGCGIYRQSFYYNTGHFRNSREIVCFCGNGENCLLSLLFYRILFFNTNMSYFFVSVKKCRGTCFFVVICFLGKTFLK